ncbi:methyltransferase domain-containing protein [Aliiglaciecola litoralis]|uniref:Malonyl-[acyl-carrier protein] O-methyltransferase n=1 Tax=Aliiglaciecola litoralis TaxID=582857 RepID=A0ABP3WQQ2_9ALTE
MVLTRKQRIAQQFGKSAKRYDHAAQVQADIGFDALQNVPMQGNRALDIGCGTGRLTKILAQRFQSVCAIDLSAGMIEQASINNAASTNIDFSVADAESIPFGDSHFDFVFSSMVLQWCDPISNSFQQAYRVLKPGGRGVIALLSEGSMHELKSVWHALGESKRVNTFYHHQHLVDEIQQVGFVLEHQQKRYITYHADTMSLLNSVRHVGASAIPKETGGAMLTRESIRQMDKVFVANFGHHQALPLTYNVSFLRVTKPS